jgi:hypothetical protein
MTKKLIVLCVILAGASSLVGQTAPPKALTIRDQVNKALGGRVIRVEPNPAYPESSPTQRVTLIVEKNGIQSRAYMDYTFEGELKIVHRRLYGSNNAVLWSLNTESFEAEPVPDRTTCVKQCLRSCSGLGSREKRRKCLAVCIGSCDLIFTYPFPTEQIK